MKRILAAILVLGVALPFSTPFALVALIPIYLARSRTMTIAGTVAVGVALLASDLISPISVPPHDNSAMDGYAFAGGQLAQGALQLEVVGTALAGKAWQGEVRTGQCVKIIVCASSNSRARWETKLA